MTPSDFLRSYADMAEANPITAQSGGGTDMENAFTAFLRAVADAEDEDTDIIADMFLLFARTLISVNMAFHEGRPCADCAAQDAEVLGDAISAELDLHLSFQSDNMGVQH